MKGNKMEQIYKAKTVDEAVEMAKQDLNLTEIDYEIVAEPKKSLFGMKGEAEIKVVYEISKAQKAKNYIERNLKIMNINVTGFEVTENEDGTFIDIKVDGDDDGVVIGRRGENLDALQYLASLAANRGTSDYYRITLDCCGYREKRKETLRKLAFRMAKTAVKTGRPAVLEPMNPFERRIIHSAVSEFEGATSHSEGEEPYRKVIITSTGKRRNERKGSGKEKYNKPNKEVDFRSSFEKEYQRSTAPTEFTAPEIPNDDVPLYGKFEF